MHKLLVTGASGFLGWNLCQVARDARWQVHGTYHQQPIAIPGVEMHAIDLTNSQAIERAISQIAPDAVIHAAAASSPNFCQTNPAQSQLINVTATADLARICNALQIPLVFTSTDLVFDGTQAPYCETDPPTPINIYGAQKLAAEREILTSAPLAKICRMPLMFGIAPPTASSFIQPWLQALKSGESLQLFVDEFRTPVSANTAATGLLMALEFPPGIVHLGGKERLSRYEFGLMLVEIFGYDRALILPISQRDLAMSAPRAADVSLDVSKAISLGYQLPLLSDELKSIARQLRANFS